jgi:hypothetical protein
MINQKIEIPITVDEITPPWLSAALSDPENGKHVNVVSVEHERIGEMRGFMGYLARLSIAYRGSSNGLPATMIVKLPDAAPEARAAQSGVFQTEIGYYRDSMNTPSQIQPDCYIAESDLESDSHVLLLEDLGGGRAVDLFTDLSISDATTGVEAFAQLHARRWNSPHLDQLSWASDGRTRATWLDGQQTYAAAWDVFAKNWGSYLPPGVDEIARAFRGSLADTMIVPPQATVTLTHGDARPENMFMVDDADGTHVRLIDWQRAIIQPGPRDIAYFLEISMSVEDRRRHERDLLAHYQSELERLGVPGLSFENLLAEYRAGLFAALVRIVPTAAGIDPDIPMAAEGAGKVLGRFVALADWDCGELLG